MRALNAAPENNALLRETIDALTENRVSTPALWLSQSAAMSPASAAALSVTPRLKGYAWRMCLAERRKSACGWHKTR